MEGPEEGVEEGPEEGVEVVFFFFSVQVEKNEQVGGPFFPFFQWK